MNNWTIKFVAALSVAAAGSAAADERTFETQAALSALGYDIGVVDGSWGKRTEAAISKFAEENGMTYSGEMMPDLWIKLASKARQHFPLPYMSLKEPLLSNGSSDLLISRDTSAKPESCQWLVDFYQHPNWGRGQPVTVNDYRGRFSQIIIPDVSKYPEYFESEANELHDSIIATTQDCYAGNNLEACGTLVEVTQMMKDEGAFVFNSPIETMGGDTFYYTTKRILNPTLVGYSVAIKKIGEPTDHAEIGDWFYSALIQNSFDVFLPERLQQKDMLFYPPPDGLTGACEKHGLSFNHSLYQALGLSFYGSIWDDENAASQAYDRLLYSVNSSALSEDGVMLCEASRGSNAMMYSGASMLNVLYTVELARNQGVKLETPDFVAEIEKAGDFLFQSAFDLSKIEPFASENHLAWCDEDYKKQCMYNAFGRIASFSWMRHFADLYPDSALAAKILQIRKSPAGNDGEQLRVSGAIAKSNFVIAEVDWTIPVESEDSHETHTRSQNGPQFLNIMDANLFSNVCKITLPQ
jgi:hypothetical protein